MKRTAILAVLAAVLLLAASASGTSAKSAAPDSLQSVIVRLKTQADLSGIRGSRATRLREIVRRLRTEADAGQRPFGALVGEWRREGRVTSFTPFWVFNGFAITAAPDVIEALSHSPAVASVTPDETMYAPSAAASSAPAEPNISLVNAPALWALGDTGQGVVVASLDTGVDLTHPDLAGRWRGGTNSWYDPFGQHPTTPTDLSGHGTQVMGVMVAGDAGGTSVGVAPGARWIAARIFNDAGQGTTSKTHLAFQWLLDPDHNPNTADAPNVVNNSWTYAAGCNLEFAQDIQTLRAAGILPVFAAGNYGSISASPANNPGALAAGSTTISDTIASDSSRGPSACGEPSNIFPELTAPGVNVRTTDLYGGYTTQSGTSLAAPHVAGALALLLSAYPNLTVARQEGALEQGAKDLGSIGPDNTYGYGRLDILAAYNALGTPDFALDVPSSASTTAGGGVSYTVTVSSSNGFAGDVSLSLSGLPQDQTSWSFSPTTVPGALGSSQLQITTSALLAVGSYPFTITGTSGALSHTVNATLVVSPPPDFALTAAFSSASTIPGGTASYTVAVSSLYGFAGDVTLSLSGLTTPAQASWSFSPTIVPGGSGSSQLQITTSASLAVGSYPLTITGTSGSLVHAAAITLVVTAPPDFTIAASPSSTSVVAGSAASYTVTVGSLNGFTGAVALSLFGLSPSYASWSFSPGVVNGSGPSTLVISTAPTAPAGTYPLTITGTSGTLSHTASVTLVVNPPPDFSLSVSPTSRTVKRGAATSYTVTVSSQGGFSSPVTVSVSGLPAGASATFSPSSVVPPGSSTMTVRTKGSTPRGTFTLTVRGTSGSTTRDVFATLIVK